MIITSVSVTEEAAKESKTWLVKLITGPIILLRTMAEKELAMQDNDIMVSKFRNKSCETPDVLINVF